MGKRVKFRFLNKFNLTSDQLEERQEAIKDFFSVLGVKYDGNI